MNIIRTLHRYTRQKHSHKQRYVPAYNNTPPTRPATTSHRHETRALPARSPRDNGINEYFEQTTNNDVRTVTTLSIDPNAQRAGVSIITTKENLLTGEYNEKSTFVPA